MLADDLTGACDAGVQFARHGLRACVWLSGASAPAADVVVISTDSRRDPADEARRRVAAALEQLAGRELVFKKVDSTLRGNILAEIEACGREEAWLAPAFPALGRRLIDGYLYVDGVRTGPRLLSRGTVRVFDAGVQEDLATIARDAFSRNPRPLLAGSAGLAIEVARLLGCPEPRVPAIEPRRGPVILYVGSTHAVTVAQVAQLKATRDRRTYHVVPVRTLEGETGSPVARYHARTASGLIMTGGDTAALVCRALGAGAIRLIREVLPGIPCGLLSGGPFHGMPVITKAGGFGREDTLSVLVGVLLEGLP